MLHHTAGQQYNDNGTNHLYPGIKKSGGVDDACNDDRRRASCNVTTGRVRYLYVFHKTDTPRE